MFSLGSLERCGMLYLPFLAIDVLSCVLAARRALYTRGASGIPLVGPIVFACLLLGVPFQGVSLLEKGFAILIAGSIHYFFVFGFPYLVRKRIK
jgi:hypothetical protein